MGEAKRRGSFEERKAQAIERKKLEEDELRELESQQQEHISKNTAEFLAIALALAIGAIPDAKS